MPWITPTQNTRLKLRPIDSAQLGTNEWRDRAAGDKLGIVSARKADGQHWEVLLAGPLTIGNKQHKSCFIFAPHWEGVGAVYQAAKAKDRDVSIAAMAQPKSEVRLPVPYLSQTDNSENPGGSCNVTSFAMCMRYFGVKQRTNAAQFEDELYRYMESQGLSRHSPHDLRKMAIDYGLSVDFDSKATIERVKRHLSSGRPCVCHGYFTSFGHIVVFVGYNDRGFLVHDPYGEWHSWGYERNGPSNPTLGKYQHYSYGLIERTCLTGGEFWVHFVDRAGWQPTTAAPTIAAPQHNNKKITQADIDRAAAEIGVESRALKAVIAVEASGSGFLPSGRCKILFEAQWFGYYSGDKYNQSHPHISALSWDRSLYKGGEAEWDRLEEAARLDKKAAYMSASYGIGQIMGFHWESLGYKSVFEFADRMNQSEGEQLLAMARFIKANGAMLRALKNKQWADFAYHYNGEGYKANQYDVKLASAYAQA